MRSTYDYFRHHPSDGDPLSEAANQFEFGAYIRLLLEQFPEQVDNPQTILLANGAADRETVPDDLTGALNRMRETVFLGVVDMYRQSVAAGRHRMRAIFPWLDFVQPPANVSREVGDSVTARHLQFRESVGRPVYREVLRLNLLDFRLLRAARAEVRRRCAQVPQRGPDAAVPNARAAVKPSRLPWALRREEERKRRCGIFDAAFYLEKYPDLRAAGVDPLRHYVEHGAVEGRKPHRLFDTRYYLRQRPEASAAGVDPLVDFLEGGARSANPHPLFDCAGDARRLVDYATAKHRTPMGSSIVISDESLDVESPPQRAFFEAVRPDQLRAQIAVEPGSEAASSNSSR